MASPTPSNDQEQYLRKCTLVVSGQGLNGSSPGDPNGLDLSNLRIKFSVKRSDTATPNTADIRVYNVEEQTALSIFTKLNPTPGSPNRGQVILQAGYEDNFGVIFQGNIKQIILGRESAIDTYVDIVAGDGDRAYNFAIVNTTLAAGATQSDQVNAATGAMTSKGVTAGHLGEFPTEKLPRGKVMYGNARQYLSDSAETTKKSWSIQDGKVTFIGLTTYLPGEQVVLTSQTGMIGTPNQTNDGVNVKCLMNPKIRIGGRVHIDNNLIIRQKLNLDQIAAAKGDVKQINNLIPRGLNNDGSYYVLVIDHQGDTRGVDWYSSMVCLNIDVSANPLNSVGGSGG